MVGTTDDGTFTVRVVLLVTVAVPSTAFTVIVVTPESDAVEVNRPLLSIEPAAGLLLDHVTVAVATFGVAEN